ncbi:hypothetical protein J3E74DRAFT_476003 [Bipolaris maydis]|nr:hypothetical protein J3E74DRAFT_476003 [Bipolaris maydis]
MKASAHFQLVSRLGSYLIMAQGTPDRTRSRFVQPKGWPTTLLDWAPVQDTQGDHQGANGLPRMLTHMDYDHMYACQWGEFAQAPGQSMFGLAVDERAWTRDYNKYMPAVVTCLCVDRIKTCVKRWQRRVCKAMRREDREHVHRLILSRAPGPPACSCQSTTSRGKWLAAGQILLSDKRPRKGNARSRSDPPSQFPASNHLAITISTKFSVQRGAPCGATDKISQSVRPYQHGLEITRFESSPCWQSAIPKLMEQQVSEDNKVYVQRVLLESYLLRSVIVTTIDQRKSPVQTTYVQFPGQLIALAMLWARHDAAAQKQVSWPMGRYVGKGWHYSGASEAHRTRDRERESVCVRACACARVCVLWKCRRLRAGSVGLEARKAGRVPVACNGDASDGAATMSHWHAGATQAGSVSVCGAACGKNATWVGDSAAAIVFQSIREQNSRAGTSICV